MALLPRGKPEVAHRASLEESVTEVQPLMEAPFALKPTVPVGEAPPLTVAVNVADSPEMEGFRLEVTAVVVAVWLAVLTTCVMAPVLGALSVSPE